MNQARVAAAAALLCVTLASAACEDRNTPTTPTNAAETIVFSSQLHRGGFAWRTIAPDAAGEARIQLVSVTPETTAAVGLGFGTFDGTNCTITSTVEAVQNATTPQLTVSVQPGTYCVRIWDIGNLTRLNTFAITVVIP